MIEVGESGLEHIDPKPLPTIKRHCLMRIFFFLVEGSVGVKLSTVWTDEAADVGRVREEKKQKI